MKTITIAPLATPKSIPLAVWEAVTHASRLFLQTAEHPCARPILAAGLPFESMDDLYESAEDFDALAGAIAQRLLSAEGDAVYAVPGRGVGAAQLSAIRKAVATGQNGLFGTPIRAVWVVETALAGRLNRAGGNALWHSALCKWPESRAPIAFYHFTHQWLLFCHMVSASLPMASCHMFLAFFYILMLLIIRYKLLPL